MKSGVKKYNTAYKKRVLERDTYLPTKIPQGNHPVQRLWSFLLSASLDAEPA